MQMQLKPEERSKAILCVLGSVIALGFAVKTVLGAKPQPIPQPASSSTSTVSASITPASAVAMATPQQSDAVAQLYMQGSAPAPMTRDPFKPPVAVYVPAADSKKKTPGSAPGLPQFGGKGERGMR